MDNIEIVVYLVDDPHLDREAVLHDAVIITPPGHLIDAMQRQDWLNRASPPLASPGEVHREQSR